MKGEDAMEKQLNVNQVAEILGLHENTVRDYFQAARFPGAYKIGSDWRISESDLERWVACKKNPEGFIERELRALKDSPEYKAKDDPVTRENMEKNIRDIWTRAQHGKKKR